MHLLQHLDYGLSFDAAVKATATAELASPATIRNEYTEFIEAGTITPPKTSHRGSGNPNHPRHLSNSKLTFRGELIIHQLLQTVREDNTQETITTLRAALEQHGIVVSRTTVFRRLHELAYRFTNKRFIGATTFKVLLDRRRAFVYCMASARRLEQEGTHIIVPTDESYAHQRRATKKIWCSTHHPDSHLVRGDADGGRRLIILDAMTKDGLLHQPGAEPTSNLSQRCPSARLVFESHGSDGDYHKCMNGENFVLWMKNRLFPAFEARYPGKKMILLLDNVKYHHHRGPLWITPRKMDQDALAVTLAEHVSQIEVVRGRGRYREKVTIKSRYYQSCPKSKPPGPTITELRTALTQWFKDHPQITEVRRLMDEKGYLLLYTPPFQPEVQPIELLWGTIKKSIAKLHVRGRTIHQTRQQVLDALSAITLDQIASYFKRTDASLEAWLQEDEELRQFGSFSQLTSSPALVYQSATSEAQIDNEYSEDEETDSDEEEENDT